MKVFENQFVRFDVYAEDSLLALIWTNENNFMEASDFKKINLELLKYFETYQISRLLSDCKNQDFVVTPDLQYWMAEEIFPASAASGLRKVAFLVPNDVFTSTSIEQTMEEERDKIFSVNYFINEEKARKWLFERAVLAPNS